MGLETGIALGVAVTIAPGHCTRGAVTSGLGIAASGGVGLVARHGRWIGTAMDRDGVRGPGIGRTVPGGQPSLEAEPGRVAGLVVGGEIERVGPTYAQGRSERSWCIEGEPCDQQAIGVEHLAERAEHGFEGAGTEEDHDVPGSHHDVDARRRDAQRAQGAESQVCVVPEQVRSFAPGGLDHLEVCVDADGAVAPPSQLDRYSPSAAPGVEHRRWSMPDQLLDQLLDQIRLAVHVLATGRQLGEPGVVVGAPVGHGLTLRRRRGRVDPGALGDGEAGHSGPGTAGWRSFGEPEEWGPGTPGWRSFGEPEEWGPGMPGERGVLSMGMTSTSFALTYDYRCPFARNAHEHVVSALRAGAPWEVRFAPFSLTQAHVEDGGRPAWSDPGKVDDLRAVAASLVVRERHPARFLDVHMALFAARHDQGRDLREWGVVSEVLGSCGVDGHEVLEALSEGWPFELFREEHQAAVEELQVFGVPTFMVGARAAFVRLMTRPQGDAAKARATVDQVLALVADAPELNELKHTTVPR